MTPSSIKSSLLRHPVWLGLGIALIVLAVLFDWNWFRGPLERYVSKKTQREFTISHLDVDLGWNPTIRMQDVYFGNAAWSKSGEPMARVERVEFSVSLRDLPGKVLVPRVALTKPQLLFEKLADESKNWVFSDPSDKSPSKLRISTLSVDQGQLRFVDHGEPFLIDVKARTFDPGSQAQVTSVDAKPVNNKYAAEYSFTGKYHGSGFSGTALTGEVLSFQESEVPFPLKGSLVAGTTRVDVEGTIADAVNISAIDAQLRIQGQTMANLYPFLLLPLPASPPYLLQGRLQLKGNRYGIDNLTGKIGSSDVAGKVSYIIKQPRPLLTADLRSKLLNVTDLGPLVGVQTRGSGGKPAVSQADTSNKAAATAKQDAIDPNHILPSGKFDGSRLQKIDAQVNFTAAKLEVPSDLPLESMRASLRLENAVLKLSPLEFGFAGGSIASQVTLDARKPIIHTSATVKMRGVQVAKLVPDKKTFAQGAGVLGAYVELQGSGNSIADAAAKADGRVSAAVANGRISNLLDAASGLNGGKVLSLLAGGDQTIKVNCGGFDFDVKNGLGKASVFVVDTEQTQILGNGGFDLGKETFDLVVTPMPKRMGILSLRTPVHAFGTFKKPQYELQKGPLIARAGGALALLAVSPLAALLPLLETGPGEDTDCLRLQSDLSGATKQALSAPSKSVTGKSAASAPAANPAAPPIAPPIAPASPLPMRNK